VARPTSAFAEETSTNAPPPPRSRIARAAATQAFAILLCVIALLVGSFALIIAGLFAAVAVILLLGERDRPRRTSGKT